MTIGLFAHYFIIAMFIVVTCIGVAVAQYKIYYGSLSAINIQPAAKSDIMKTSLLCATIAETAAILSLIMAFFLLSKKDISSNSFIAELGIFAAVSLTGFFSSYFSSNLCAAGLISITRQPFLAKQISNITVIMQSLMQTPLIFGFIIALVIQSLDYKIFESKESAIVCLAAGLAISLGSLGPLLGSRVFSFSVCESIGFNRHALTKITSFSVLSQAIIETPIIFSAILSFWIIGFIQDSHDIYKAYIFLLVALLLFVGNLGPGYNSGKIASSACKQIAINPHIYSSLSKTSMLAQGIIDTSAIYCFVISMCLIIFR